MAHQGNQSEHKTIAAQWGAAKEKRKSQVSAQSNVVSTPGKDVKKAKSVALSKNDSNQEHIRQFTILHSCTLAFLLWFLYVR